ncbi:DUF3089 domain-containing protein [Robiginitomaculum antarcticum]|uniref:DUF3089 domain-containing protein n=1 Tax=Robiginitomaculum antarcticum TaxID=437507 RepID=UPI000367DA75|nr:DUF3089 domain-containing protein [Robiginitomaculum antarcticum]
MTSNRLKTIFLISTLAALALLLVATWFYRDDMFRYFNDPGQPFQTYNPPLAPDYTSRASWIELPGAFDSSTLNPDQADIFVVGPTQHLGGKNWVADAGSAEFRADVEHVIAPNYIRPLGVGGRVFAPYYREAALYSFLTNRDDAVRAQTFAFGDIARAFAVFLSVSPPERPIVIVGYGQGGLHVQRLLQTKMDRNIKTRLVAAYIIDHPTPLAALGDIPVCETARQTGCAVAFTTVSESEGLLARQYVTKTLFFDGGNLKATDGHIPICVNPLLWKQSSDYAPARLHKGAIAASGLPEGTDPPAIDHQFGAQCEDGLLVIDMPKASNLRRPARFGGHYRTPPYNLFSEDIRQNMMERIAARHAAGDLPRRAPKLEPLDIIDVEDVPVTPAD